MVFDLSENLPAVAFRIWAKLEEGALPDVLECIRLAGQSPTMSEMTTAWTQTAIFDFVKISEPAAKALCDWLRRVEGVREIQIEWYPTNTPGEGSGNARRHGNIRPEHRQHVFIQRKAEKRDSLTLTL
jgi:hypothetical protein